MDCVFKRMNPTMSDSGEGSLVRRLPAQSMHRQQFKRGRAVCMRNMDGGRVNRPW